MDIPLELEISRRFGITTQGAKDVIQKIRNIQEKERIPYSVTEFVPELLVYIMNPVSVKLFNTLWATSKTMQNVLIQCTRMIEYDDNYDSEYTHNKRVWFDMPYYMFYRINQLDDIQFIQPPIRVEHPDDIHRLFRLDGGNTKCVPRVVSIIITKDVSNIQEFRFMDMFRYMYILDYTRMAVQITYKRNRIKNQITQVGKAMYINGHMQNSVCFTVQGYSKIQASMLRDFISTVNYFIEMEKIEAVGMYIVPSYSMLDELKALLPVNRLYPHFAGDFPLDDIPYVGIKATEVFDSNISTRYFNKMLDTSTVKRIHPAPFDDVLDQYPRLEDVMHIMTPYSIHRNFDPKPYDRVITELFRSFGNQKRRYELLGVVPKYGTEITLSAPHNYDQSFSQEFHKQGLTDIAYDDCHIPIH